MESLPGPARSQWDRLAELSRNVFLTRDFAECWWTAYGAPGRPVVLVDSEQAPSVVVPLYVTKRPLRQIRQIGNGMADELGPVCAPEDRHVAARLVREALSARGLGWDVLLVQDAPVEQGWPELVSGRVLRSVPSPVIRLDVEDWDCFLRRRSKNFREQARRRERKLRAAYDAVIRVSTAATLEHDLDTLFHLHRMRWGSGAPFASEPQASLVRCFARRALPAGRLRLAVLELDGAPAAALLGLRFAGVHSSWQSGRDPAFEDHSTGSVLFVDAVRAAVQDGASEYRLLRGDEAYKSRFADGDRPVHTLAVGRGLVGAAAVRLAQRRRS